MTIEKIARALADSLTSTADDCPHGCRIDMSPGGLDAVVYGHVSLAGLAKALLPLLSDNAFQAGAEAMREAASAALAEKSRKARRWAAEYKAEGDEASCNGSLEEAVALIEAAQAIRSLPLPPLPLKEST